MKKETEHCGGCRYLQKERTAQGRVHMRCMRRDDTKPGRLIETARGDMDPVRPGWCRKGENDV